MILAIALATAAHAHPHADVVDVLSRFSEAVARADVAAARPLLHPAYVEVVKLPDSELVLSADGYLGGMSAGKIGGQPIELSVQGVEVRGDIATASTVRRTGALTLVSAVTLVHGEGQWTIASTATQAGPAQ